MILWRKHNKKVYKLYFDNAKLTPKKQKKTSDYKDKTIKT